CLEAREEVNRPAAAGLSSGGRPVSQFRRTSMTRAAKWFVFGGLLLAAPAVAQGPAEVKADIDTLRQARPAWREIAWKSCLLDGLATAKAKNKPVLLWVFIDRPCDDARC